MFCDWLESTQPGGGRAGTPTLDYTIVFKSLPVSIMEHPLCARNRFRKNFINKLG